MPGLTQGKPFKKNWGMMSFADRRNLFFDNVRLTPTG